MRYIDPRERQALIDQAPETDKIMHEAVQKWLLERVYEYQELREAYDKAYGLETVKDGYWIDDAFSDHLDRDLGEIVKTDKAQDPPVNIITSEYRKEPHHRYEDCCSGSDYCYSCIEEVMGRIKALRRARADAKGVPEGSLAEWAREDDIYIAPHSGANDSSMYCVICGQILECNLTEYALGEEIDHFSREETADPVTDGQLGPWAIGTLYNIEQLAEAAHGLDVLHVEEMLEVKAIIEREDTQRLISAIRERIPEEVKA